MSNLEYSTAVLAWIGLVCASVLGAGTLYFWALILWESFLVRSPFPIGLWRATKVAIQLSITRKKTDHVAYIVSKRLAEAERESPEFQLALARYLPARHNRDSESA